MMRALGKSARMRPIVSTPFICVHAQVHQGDVRLMLAIELEGLVAVGGFGHDLQIGNSARARRRGPGGRCVVIDNHDPDGIAHTFTSSPLSYQRRLD